MNKPSKSERKAISERIRDLMRMYVESDMSTGKRVICHNCGNAKPLAGAVYYGRYRLCNDCALRYELAKAEGDVQSIEGFVLTEFGEMAESASLFREHW